MCAAYSTNWAELHERARRGDDRAARALYEATAPLVYRQCLLATGGDRDAAKDLSQECWVLIFRRIGQLRRAEAFVSWALATATSHATSTRRLDARRAELLSRFALEAALDSPTNDEVEALDRERLVRAALEAIDAPKVRALAQLVYVEGRTTRAAASELGLPHGTATVTLMRLRARLRGQLVRELTGEGE